VDVSARAAGAAVMGVRAAAASGRRRVAKKKKKKKWEVDATDSSHFRRLCRDPSTGLPLA
jgi:hypothetical protein